MKRAETRDAPFQTIAAVSRLTGLSQDFIRKGVKAGKIPAIRAGTSSNATYLVDTVLFLDQLHQAAAKGVN